MLLSEIPYFMYLSSCWILGIFLIFAISNIIYKTVYRCCIMHTYKNFVIVFCLYPEPSHPAALQPSIYIEGSKHILNYSWYQIIIFTDCLYKSTLQPLQKSLCCSKISPVLGIFILLDVFLCSGVKECYIFFFEVLLITWNTHAACALMHTRAHTHSSPYFFHLCFFCEMESMFMSFIHFSIAFFFFSLIH